MKRPNPVLYFTLGSLIKLFAYAKGQRIIRNTKIKGPAIILSNHTSFFDFLYTTAGMYPARITYLGAKKYFHDPLTGFFMRLARAIPKSLMQADPAALMKAFRILRQGGIISIFPEGQISPTGTSLPPAFAIAKLLKKAGVDVFTVKHKNAYFVNPPWSKHTFRGKIETEKALLISKAELETLTIAQIYDRVVTGLHFSSSAYNKERRYRYRLQDISNLENVIYQCPHCLHEGLEANFDRLHCPRCHHELVYDAHGLLNGRGIDEFFVEQETRLRQAIDADPDFSLSGNTRLFSFREGRLQEVGRGALILRRFEYVYQGTIDGSGQRRVFAASGVPTLPSDIGRNVQIYEGDQIYQFELDVPLLPTKLVHAGEYMHLLAKTVV